MTATLNRNPYAPSHTQEPYAAQLAQRGYDGIGRLVYFVMSCLTGLAFNVVNMNLAAGAGAEAAPSGSTLGIFLLAFVGYIAITLYLVAQRMINIGASAWWSLGSLVPLLNLYVTGRCLICPSGYDDHKQLDLTGKIVMGLLIIPVFLVFISVFALIFVGSAAGG